MRTAGRKWMGTMFLAAALAAEALGTVPVLAKEAYRVVDNAETKAEAKQKARKIVYKKSSSTKKNTKVKSYGYKYTRGIRYICSVDDHMDWRSDGKKVLRSSAFQTTSGICVSKMGIRKNNVRSTSYVHTYDGEKCFTFGIQVKGVTLGFTQEYVDRLMGYATGLFNVRPNV